MRRLGILLFCLFPLLTGRPDQAAAQVGVTTDILTGTVTDTSGTPLSGATVEAVSLETGLTRGASTDGRGRYRILFPDGGGRYQLFVKQIGHAPARRQVERVGDDDRLVADFRLIPQAVALEELVVSGRRQNFNDPRPTPGSTETVQTPDRLARLPARSITIILDACFTGVTRDGESLARSRSLSASSRISWSSSSSISGSKRLITSTRFS